MDSKTVARFSLEGKRALVTGASRGLGAAIALGLAEAGAHVAVTGRSRAHLYEVAGRILELRRRTVVVPADVREIPEVQRMVEEVEDRLGPLDILVNNAGVNAPRPALEVTEEEWDIVLDTNLKGLFFLPRRPWRARWWSDDMVASST